ncbi:MAG: cysteine--tRNA ligase [Candidatus Pacebacteria bacterium]|nr:cysteine--tRNA ligase [Candidatus Paceibacterota bacterium]
MVLKIYNTLGREKQEFIPLKDDVVSFYYCGPTVYSRQHIGNLRGAFCADSIRRSLEYLKYNVSFISNYTDVGHLTGDNEGDADLGEDRMEKGVRQEGLSPAEIADKYIKFYEDDIKELNISSPTTRCRATDYIQEMIDMVQVLLDKGFAYQTDSAIYFDITKAKNYTELSGQQLDELKSGAGTGDIEDSQKRNTGDFAIWFFKTGTHENALQTWESPWGEACLPTRQGFPGWHIECSAMAKKHLGNTIDIHMGGVEHVSIHHSNEIAQSESANGVKFSNFWMHNEHLGIDGTKMSKSLGNVVYIDHLKEKGINPLVLRFFFSQAHYRSKQNFTWEALEAAKNGYGGLLNSLSNLGEIIGSVSEEYKTQFIEKLSDDFNIPQALAFIHEVLKSNLSDSDKLATVLDFDEVLGLDLKENKDLNQGLNIKDLPQDIQDLFLERNLARENQNWAESDRIRDEIESEGYLIKDSEIDTQIFKK